VFHPKGKITFILLVLFYFIILVDYPTYKCKIITNIIARGKRSSFFVNYIKILNSGSELKNMF